MKKTMSLSRISIVMLFSVFTMSITNAQPITGAWEKKESSTTHTLVIADDYFSISSFDIPGKKFINTYGGTANISGNGMKGKIEFNAADKSMVGKDYTYSISSGANQLTLTRDGKEEKWTRTDDGKSPLAGNWRIIRRDENPMNPGARKTIKLLSGKRFQWAAINTATGEFFGTGGGNYTFENGKYTENIEFFSRDASRVGMSLSFDGKVEGKQWHHSGLSSRGDKINEVWARE